jgi:HAD superfamily phosphoserine phosphatase-like hydrolase
MNSKPDSKPETPWAYFDFDDTIVRGDSILDWNRFLFRHAPHLKPLFVLQWIGLGLYLLRLQNSHNYKRWLLAPASYLKPEIRERLAREFALTALPQRAYAEMLQIMQSHKDQGHQVAVLSASGSFYLKHIGDWLPVDHVVGTEMVFPERGFVRLPRYTSTNFKGPAKVEYLESHPEVWAPQNQRFAYSDHHVDLPLLKWAGQSQVIWPTGKLRKQARNHDWQMHRPQTRVRPRGMRDKLGRLAKMLFGWI